MPPGMKIKNAMFLFCVCMIYAKLLEIGQLHSDAGGIVFQKYMFLDTDKAISVNLHLL